MATSSLISVSHTLHSSLWSKRKSRPLSPITSLFSSPQVGHKFISPPLRYNTNNNGVSPIGMSPKSKGFVVKASVDAKKNIEVLTKEHLTVSLAKHVADLSNEFVERKDCFTIVLSGDRSVKYLKKLVEPPYIDTVNWSKWHVFWVDEKVVPKTHVESNYKLTYDRFLCKVPIPDRNINTIDVSLPADKAADEYEKTLKSLVTSKVIASSANELPKFDLILLDMGPDGHVASLFPGNPVLDEDEKWVTYINNAPNPPRHRITLTLPVINSSSNIAMVVTGAGKADAVYTAVMEKSESSEKLPIQLISPEGDLKWFLDKGAASKLYY